MEGNDKLMGSSFSLSYRPLAFLCLSFLLFIITPTSKGQITTTLNALSRVIDDYDQMAKKEMKTDKREKALLWVKKKDGWEKKNPPGGL
jgi:hypothetical protein